MGFFFGRGKGKSIPRNATFRLTQEGTEKLQTFSGDPRSQILLALQTGGTGNIEEISRGSGLSRGQVERTIPGLMQGGYIQPVSATSIAEGMD